MSKEHTFYAKNSGMEIATTTVVKEKDGAVMKDGRVRLRFFNLGSDSSMFFMMKPDEAFTLALKASEAVMDGRKHAFTHKYTGKDGEVITKLAVDSFQTGKEGQKVTRYALIWSRGENNQVNVPMSAEAMLYLAELARAFSVEQAWTSFKKPDGNGKSVETEEPGAEIEEVEEGGVETEAQAMEPAATAQAEAKAFQAVTVKGLTKTGKAIVDIGEREVYETRHTRRAEGISVAIGTLIEVAVENGWITEIRQAA
ncbi:MAG: hypothetical protein HZA04_02935 [Nitrospinae bacterium]|nr:hypothetical protein [Nitrospinota bacterium]